MNSFGRYFRVTTWGESHGPGIGVVIDGCPARLDLSAADIQKELDLRKPGQDDLSSPRQEEDAVEVLSGVFQGKTTGAPISLLIRNRDVCSGDYEKIKDIFRPGHADFTYQQKYGHRDYRGSGRASGRETAARVAAGAVAQKILARHGIAVVGFVRRIGRVAAAAYFPKALPVDFTEIDLTEGDLAEKALAFRCRVYKSPVRCPEEETARAMAREIRQAAEQGDSVGGIVEVRAYGLQPGLGDPVFGKLDALISQAVLSVGAVKGVEFGEGFGFAELRGSVANDPFRTQAGLVRPATNKAGGVLGGISTGAPLIIRAVVKPTPSIKLEQDTVDREGRPVVVSVGGRHDPCIAIRVVTVLEHMVNLVLVDLLFSKLAVEGVRHE